MNRQQSLDNKVLTKPGYAFNPSPLYWNLRHTIAQGTERVLTLGPILWPFGCQCPWLWLRLLLQ
jgi:hypothetical protein